MKFGSDNVLSKSPNFMDFGLSSVNTTDELGSLFLATTKIRRPTDGSNWILPVHDSSEATADKVIRAKANNHYNLKSEFETRRDRMVAQDFGHEKFYESTNFGLEST